MATQSLVNKNPVDKALKNFRPALPLAIAYSGGADSSALLHLCARRWAGEGGIYAIHVHHGLQEAAEDFVQHCRQVCASLDVPLALAYVDARPQSGQSPEDAARQHRYRALVEKAQTGFSQPAASIAIAQHADDQIETLLLALSRGSGVAGLASMPAQWQRFGMDWHRPLLGVAGKELRRWLEAQNLSWIEDPTNAQNDYTRNRIRHQILPVLEEVLPQFRATFARSCRHAAEADQLLTELAEQDAHQCGISLSSSLKLDALRNLSATRQINVLRYWLKSEHGVQASTAQMDELQRQLSAWYAPRRNGQRRKKISIRVALGWVLASCSCPSAVLIYTPSYAPSSSVSSSASSCACAKSKSPV